MKLSVIFEVLNELMGAALNGCGAIFPSRSTQ